MKNSLLFFLSLFILISSCTTSEIPLEPTEPITTTVSYNANVKVIIDNNCISCHINSGVASFLPLVNYNQVKTAAESGSLIARMNSIAAPMPQSGLLSTQTRAIIQKWKDDGFLEN